MFVDLIIGAVVMVGILLLVNYAKKQNMTINWWQWTLTILGFIYATFVLEVIHAFLEEGTGKGAFVIGLILAIVAVIWGVLLGRTVFAKQA